MVGAERTAPIVAWSRAAADAATAGSGPGAGDVTDESVKPNPKSDALLLTEKNNGTKKHSHKERVKKTKKQVSKTCQADLLIGSFLALSNFGTGAGSKALDITWAPAEDTACFCKGLTLPSSPAGVTCCTGENHVSLLTMTLVVECLQSQLSEVVQLVR